MQREQVFALHVMSQSFNHYIGVQGSCAAEEQGNNNASLEFDAKRISRFYDSLLKQPQGDIRNLEGVLRRLPSRKTNLMSVANLHLLNLAEVGAQAVMWTDGIYPKSLRYIDDAPLGLSVLGSHEALQKPMVAIVGARRPSAYALRETYLLAKFMAHSGFTVVSGGAFGCDRAAHMGALSAGKENTVVVQAGGISNLYPKRHQLLFKRIVERGGCVLSEKLGFHRPSPSDFPVRNRIISGLATVVVIMHADKRSGSIQIANTAVNQGRDVAVLNQGKSTPQGSAQLIDEGALVAGCHKGIARMIMEAY